jgi:hypothetical protein
MSAMTESGIFAVSMPGEQPVGLVGPWQPGPELPVSFGLEAEQEAPVWRVNLPEQPGAAQQALQEASAQLAASAASLDRVPVRLERLASAGLQSGGLSFDTASGLEPGSPEASAAQLLAEALALEQGKDVSFGGVEAPASQAWEQARASFERFLSQLQREVLHLAWVETFIASQLLARSATGWSGDSQTIWREGADPEQMQLHRRSLELAIRSRLLRIRIFSTVSSGAAKLAVLFTTPAGALLALPAAWKFVDEILGQIKTYQTISQGESNGN